MENEKMLQFVGFLRIRDDVSLEYTDKFLIRNKIPESDLVRKYLITQSQSYILIVLWRFLSHLGILSFCLSLLLNRDSIANFFSSHSTGLLKL